MKISVFILCISIIFLAACSAHKYDAKSVIKLPSYCTVTSAVPLTPDPNVLSYELINCTHEDYNVFGSMTVYKDIAPLATQASYNQQQFDRYSNISDGSLMQSNENGTVYKVRGNHKSCSSEYWITESNITYTKNYLNNPRLVQWQADMINSNKTEYYQVMIVIDNNMLLGMVDSYVDNAKRDHDIETYLNDTRLLC